MVLPHVLPFRSTFMTSRSSSPSQSTNTCWSTNEMGKFSKAWRNRVTSLDAALMQACQCVREAHKKWSCDESMLKVMWWTDVRTKLWRHDIRMWCSDEAVLGWGDVVKRWCWDAVMLWKVKRWWLGWCGVAMAMHSDQCWMFNRQSEGSKRHPFM